MNLSKSIELLMKLNDGKNYDKEFNLVKDNFKIEQVTAREILEKISESNIDYINKKIIELHNSNLYQRESYIHGKKHIENVMLFAMIISLYENLNEKDRELLLESAKFHDQGRVNDNDVLHGISSAVAAKELLSNKYNEDDLKIIQAAIIFHDDRTKGNSLKEIEDIGFSNIVNKLLIKKSDIIRTRKIGNILKDADALDRARFSQDDIPIDIRYLRCDISRKMIKLAIELHEAYSLEELNEYIEKNPNAKENVLGLLDKTSPIRVKEYYLQK